MSNRLAEHNSGKVDATKSRRPLKVLYLETASDSDNAKQREKYWKTGGGRRRLKKYFECGFPPNSLRELGEARPD